MHPFLRGTLLIGVALGVAACNENPDGGIGLAPGTGGGTTGFQVTATTPVNLAVGVATATAVQATFSGPLDTATVSTATFLLSTAGGGAVTGQVQASLQTATFQPDAPLSAGTQYVATVTAAVADTAGTVLGTDFVWTFTTTN